MTSSKAKLQVLFDDALGLPPAASAWLLDLWDVIQVFDDVADGDDVPRKQLHDAIWRSLVGLPSHPFYVENAGNLLPILANAFLKWVGSDEAERAGQADEKSFVWRASYYDVVLMVVLLTQGKDAALTKAAAVMSMYGEDFGAYRKEFAHA